MPQKAPKSPVREEGVFGSRKGGAHEERGQQQCVQGDQVYHGSQNGR